MRLYSYLLIAALIFSGCSSKRSSDNYHRQSYQRHYSIIIDAEHKATPAGSRVLRTARDMATSGEIIRGACWDYLNTAYLRAGYPYAKRKRVYVSRKGGPYAPLSMIKPGDWLYYIITG